MYAYCTGIERIGTVEKNPHNIIVQRFPFVQQEHQYVCVKVKSHLSTAFMSFTSRNIVLSFEKNHSPNLLSFLGICFLSSSKFIFSPIIVFLLECKDTIKRAKNQIYLSFSEREYLRRVASEIQLFSHSPKPFPRF